MDRSLYEDRSKNLHSWAGHLESTIEAAVPLACSALSPPGEEDVPDSRDAAEALSAVSKGLDEVMSIHDLLLESIGRPRQYDDSLQDLVDEPAPPAGRASSRDQAPAQEINRARYSHLSAELHHDAGRPSGAIHGAMVGVEKGSIDGHHDGLASGIEEPMVSYDPLQDLIGMMPASLRFFDRHMVILEEEGRARPSR